MNEGMILLKEMLAKRHSEYALAPEWVASEQEVEQLLAHVLQLTPSHFNAQTVRMVLLTGTAHQEHWHLVEQALIGAMGKERYEKSTRAKVENSFASGAGTVLFFDDTTVTKQLMEKMPAYASNFATWAQQVQGSHQLLVWIGLTQLGFGASLQHYIGMNDDKIRAQVGVPNEWSFVAHMPFGKIVTPADPKDKLPLSDMLRVVRG